MQKLGLLGVFAHPDDEQLMSGAFAQAASEGIRTGLVCATRGEMGEISDPSLATPENLGHVRELELRAASAVLGVKYLWFLDYRDSGMMGTPPNDDPASFFRSNEDQAIIKIVRIIREFKPTVICTFEPEGGYGHPDHITISRLTTRAFDAAADPAMYPEAGEPWQAARLYYSAFPRSTIVKMREFLTASGVDLGLGTFDADRFGLPDEQVTNKLDTSRWIDLKMKSLQMHRTQFSPDSPWSKMPEDLTKQMRGLEYYALAKGTPVPADDQASGDLFAGLREA